MLSEIGSNFWLDPSQKLCKQTIGTPEQFRCKGSDFVWLSTGRSAIKFVIKTIEERKPGLKKIAVLPSFTCDTVFEPFIKAGYEVFYYPIEKDLTTTSNAILKTVFDHDASIVLFHRYFGFDTLDGNVDKMCEALRSLGKYSIEDCTQCLYSDIPRAKSDFTVGSIRKWIGTPDGGFAVCRDGEFKDKPKETDLKLEKAKVKASYAKYRFLFLHEGDKSEMLSMYREAEDILDKQGGFYAISEMSEKVQANLNKADLIKKRRENFSILNCSLTNAVKPVFALGINDKEVPLYFPILVEDRTSLQKYLVSNAIYAPVVWPKDEAQFAQCDGAENAYQHLLCIPIDQRYDADDMNRIVKVINNLYNE
jgi:dTDP-4-amino-4,6-dideoxygalactose transaminase